jgi:TPR repeat protein
MSAELRYAGMRKSGTERMRSARVNAFAAAIVVLTALAIITTSGVADPLSDAESAYDRKDYATAVAILRPLAEHGNATAQFRLGQFYEVGLGVPRDYGRAVQWLKEAAQQENVEAQAWLADAYYFGRGAPPSQSLAAFWNQKAAEHGYPEAQLSLGYAYSDGDGVAVDTVEAYKWLTLAQNGAHDPSLPTSWTKDGDLTNNSAHDALVTLSRKMTVEQIKRAQELVVAFSRK